MRRVSGGRKEEGALRLNRGCKFLNKTNRKEPDRTREKGGANSVVSRKSTDLRIDRGKVPRYENPRQRQSESRIEVRL